MTQCARFNFTLMYSVLQFNCVIISTAFLVCFRIFDKWWNTSSFDDITLQVSFTIKQQVLDVRVKTAKTRKMNNKIKLRGMWSMARTINLDATEPLEKQISRWTSHKTIKVLVRRTINLLRRLSLMSWQNKSIFFCKTVLASRSLRQHLMGG